MAKREENWGAILLSLWSTHSCPFTAGYDNMQSIPLGGGIAILNSKKKGHWGSETSKPLLNMAPGANCEISIVCDDKDFKISVNDKFWCSFKHRLPYSKISHIVVRGNITLDGITYNYGAGERQLCEWYWRGLGGHILKVEGGAGGVTWAISHDYHVYTFTGATGGGLYKDAVKWNVAVKEAMRVVALEIVQTVD
ncbi:hypothetical protein SK128_027834 [Halocaridina rubra]|uniref:Galectin n=1 Tax=Halocaridina rubra TaxID=373956 RepID=A0AAN8ZY91_HALRR